MNKNWLVGMVVGCSLALCQGIGWAQDAYPVIFEAVHKAILSAEATGVLKSVKYDSGDKVKQGEILAQVDSGELALRKKRAQLSLKHLKVKVENLSRLSQRGLATKEALEEARMERDITQTDIEILKRQISKTLIRAPYNCVVVKRVAQPHEWVTAGQPVMEVLAPKPLKAVANIASNQAVNIKKGMEHQFFVHDLGITITGKVSAVVPLVDELSNTTQVIWTIDNPSENLLPGMKGEIRLGQ